jgi:hypothetical protein
VVTDRAVRCIFASMQLKQAIHPFYSIVFLRGAVDLAIVRREDKVAMSGSNLLVLHDFFSPGQTNAGDTSFDNGLNETWYELGVGMTASMGKSSALYANMRCARNLSGEYRQDVFGQAGYLYSW